MDPQLHDTLKRHFGFDTFLDNQEPIVESVLAGRDLCVIMPTGAGKSIVYQVPALLFPGKKSIQFLCVSETHGEVLNRNGFI